MPSALSCRGEDSPHQLQQLGALPGEVAACSCTPQPSSPSWGGLPHTPHLFPALQKLLLLSFRGIKKKVYSHPRTSHLRNKDILLQPGRSRWLLPWDTAAFPQRSPVPQHSHCPGARQNGELPTALQSATSLNQA